MKQKPDAAARLAAKFSDSWGLALTHSLPDLADRFRSFADRAIKDRDKAWTLLLLDMPGLTTAQRKFIDAQRAKGPK